MLCSSNVILEASVLRSFTTTVKTAANTLSPLIPKSILMSRKRNAIVAAGLVVFASAGLAFPFYMALKSSKSPVIDSSKPLPPQATFRGPYINTGSRDVGPDDKIYPKK